MLMKCPLMGKGSPQGGEHPAWLMATTAWKASTFQQHSTVMRCSGAAWQSGGKCGPHTLAGGMGQHPMLKEMLYHEQSCPGCRQPHPCPACSPLQWEGLDVRHPPPPLALEISPLGIWQPLTPPEATASSDGSSVLLTPKGVVPAESQAFLHHPEQWDPALSEEDILLAVIFPLMIPPHPFMPTS